MNLYGDRDQKRNGGHLLESSIENNCQDVVVDYSKEGDEMDRKNSDCEEKLKSNNRGGIMHDISQGQSKAQTQTQGQGQTQKQEGGEGQGDGEIEGKSEAHGQEGEGKGQGEGRGEGQVCVGFDFLGAALSDKIACAIADGLMDPTTLVRKID